MARNVRSKTIRRFGFAVLLMAAGLAPTLPALASPQQCGALWVERNRPFAEAGLCVETTLWKAVFPNISCKYTSGADVGLPEEIAARLTEIRAQETQLGCRIDSGFGDPETAARSLWLDIGDQGSVFSAKDGYANLRDAPSAKSGNLIGRLDDGGRVKILERVQSPDNNALWFRVSYADNVGKLRNAYVHYASVFPKRDVMGMFDVAQSIQLKLINLDGANPAPSALRVRFWTEEHPSDIWPVLSHPTYTRGGQEQMKFNIAFSATEGWSAEELVQMASVCQWREGKRHADCAGKAGRFRVVAGRAEGTGDLLGLGVHLNTQPGNGPEAIVPAGFDGRVIISATREEVQLGIAVDGSSVVKSGILLPDSAKPSTATTVSAQTTEPVAAQAPAAAASAPIPEQASEAMVDFDELMDLTE